MLCAEAPQAGEEFSAIAGGADLSSSAGGKVAIVETRPTGLAGEVPTGWIASAVEVNPTDASWTLTVYALCARVN